MRKPRDLAEYVDAATVLRFLQAQVDDIKRRELANPKMVYKVKMVSSYWVDGWEKPTRTRRSDDHH